MNNERWNVESKTFKLSQFPQPTQWSEIGKRTLPTSRKTVALDIKVGQTPRAPSECQTKADIALDKTTDPPQPLTPTSPSEISNYEPHKILCHDHPFPRGHRPPNFPAGRRGQLHHDARNPRARQRPISSTSPGHKSGGPAEI